MKVVVAGGGSVGRFTAEQLVAAGHEVTIIENDRSVVSETQTTIGCLMTCGALMFRFQLHISSLAWYRKRLQLETLFA
ncbi:MAG: hypothetical protein EBR53_00150 [Actinobacteria bacterium]|nr:hypothetical protein [Actinomycetota bacterium]